MNGKINNPICGECEKKIDVLIEEFVFSWENKIFHKSCYKNPFEELKKAVMETHLGKLLYWTLDRLSQMINWFRKIWQNILK